MRSLTFCTLLLALAACGDNGGTTDSTTTDATTGTTSPSSTGGTGTTDEPTTSGTTTTGEPQTGSDSMATTMPGETGDTTTTDAATTTTDVETTTTDATTGSTGGSTDETTSGTTGAATSDLVIAIVDAELYADCMPEIDPDPAWGSWYVEYDNTANAEATSATLIKATLSLLVDDPKLEEIEATPIESGPLPAGEYISQKLTKVQGAAHSACEHCGEFYLLALDYQEGDVVHHVTEEVTISCSF